MERVWNLKTENKVRMPFRNAHGINLATGEGFMLVFNARQQAHSRLRNCCCNEEDEYKDKRVVEVISCTFLSEGVNVLAEAAVIFYRRATWEFAL